MASARSLDLKSLERSPQVKREAPDRSGVEAEKQIGGMATYANPAAGEVAKQQFPEAWVEEDDEDLQSLESFEPNLTDGTVNTYTGHVV